MANEKEVEVKEGLKSGEAVILNPITLMTEEEKRPKFSQPTKPVARRKARSKPAPGTSPQP